MFGTNLQGIWHALSTLADEIGDADAILAPGSAPLCFTALRDRVADVGETLCGLGIHRGDRIVSVLPRGPEAAVCFFGVASYATYAPLNPDYTQAELAGYIERLRPKAIIVATDATAAVRDVAARANILTLELRPDASAPAGTFTLACEGKRRRSDPQPATAADVALILLTSGTTARPKLVPLKHRHLLAVVRAGRAHFQLTAGDRHLHTMPMFHGNGLKSALAMPILAGSAVICFRHFDVPTFFDTMAALKPTWYSASYAIQRAIVDRIHDYRRVARDAKLRFIVSGSGQMDARVARALEDAFAAPILERYSMSETGMIACSPLPPRIAKPGTVGVPVENETRIVDEGGAAVGGNREGEILVRGPGVFEGYLDDPAHNASAFRDGWFHTGDLGYLDEDGYLTITGRRNELINRGGEKIGPLEVERAIAGHPAVTSVCVFAVPHPTLGDEVAAAVVPVDGAVVSEKSIIEFAMAHLAPFKVPRCILFATELPRGASGKIDRKALAQEYATLRSTASPRSGCAETPGAIASELAKLWRKLLKTERIASDVDFFLAGGDSLMVAELFVAIRQRFGVNVSMRHIFDEGATIAGLGRLIEHALKESGRTSALPRGLMPIKADGERPALFAVPDIDGNPGTFIHFGRLLDARQPMYGLESRGLEGEAAPLDSIEAIAADHIATIRDVQPHGPYYLIGACFGGRVAYEMARQLEAAGEPIALVAMLDPSPPFTNSRGEPRGRELSSSRARERLRIFRFIARRLRLYAHEVVRLDGRQRVAFIRSRLRLAGDILRRADPFRGDRSELHRIAVFEANQAAGQRYVPQSYAGPAVVALAAGSVPSGPRNYRLDWLDLMPRCASPRYVPGRDTGDMLTPPDVYTLVQRVNEWIEEAHAADSAPAEGIAPRTAATR